MKIPVLFLSIVVFLSGCSAGTAGPSKAQIKDLLETQFRAELQRTVDMAGAQWTQEAVGVSSPEDITVDLQAVEHMEQLDNGDYAAKVVYVKHMRSNEIKMAVRLTLSKSEGKWKIVGREELKSDS